MQTSLKDKINKIYLTSVDPDELLKAYQEISTIYLNNPSVKSYMKINPEVAKEYGIYESLSFRLNAKLLLINYFMGYTAEAKSALCEYVDSVTKISKEKNYAKTTIILNNVLAFINYVSELMADAVASVNRVRDGSGELATDNVPFIREAFSTVKKALDKARNTTFSLIFPENVTVPDFAGRIIKDLEEECEWFRGILAQSQNSIANKALIECTVSLKSLGMMTDAEFYESSLDYSKTSARVIIISTPFIDEAVLFTGVYSKAVSCDFEVLDLSRVLEFTNGDPDLASLFEGADYAEKNLLVTGIERLDDTLAENARLAILKASHGKSRFLILDKIGGRALYESFDQTASKNDELSILDVHHLFLTMPGFTSVTRLLTERGYIADSESAFAKIKKSLPFMGFVGLNNILTSDTESNWFDAAALHSSNNTDEAIIYLSKLFASRHLIDSGWGSFEGHIRFEKGEKKTFDYDDVHELDRDNVKKIMDKQGISTFDRCGLIVKYCLLSGNDISAWEGFSIADKNNRIALATKLICRILGTVYAPKVEIIAEEKWDNDTAGGCCIDGGKRIIFREKSITSYAWLENAICHECFHAFQHTALVIPYADWFFAELGVTKGRIASWDDNFKVYVGSKDKLTYRVEVVECDANAFAADCCRDIENHWKNIDFN